MFFHIDPAGELAIYDQVVRQVKFAVARGALRPGNRVPSVRELARELAVNPNTVARAYQRLQADGVLQTVRGMGLEVTPGAEKHCRQERRNLIQARIRQALAEAQQSGLDDDALRQLIDGELSAVKRDGR
jgi:GntR family transcriptional regulator